MILFLESAAQQVPTAGSWISLLLPMVIVIGLMYLLMIRPERKKQKKAEEMRSNLSLGDEITTIGGITGKVVQVTEETITFETGEDRVRIQIKKWAVSTTAKMEAEEAATRRK